MSAETFSQKMFARLDEAAAALGVKTLSRAAAGPLIDDLFRAEAVGVKPEKRKKGEPRPRDVVFDLLVELGRINAKEMTKPQAALIGKKKAELLEALPGATPEQIVAEIRERWRRWCARYPSPSMHTIPALVSHWGELGGGPATKSERLNPYVEPPWDWRAVLKAEASPGAPILEGIEKLSWFDVSKELREKFLKVHEQEERRETLRDDGDCAGATAQL